MILVDLSQVSIQDKKYKFLLDVLSSPYTSNLEFGILTLALSTKVKRYKSKYII